MYDYYTTTTHIHKEKLKEQMTAVNHYNNATALCYVLTKSLWCVTVLF